MHAPRWACTTAVPAVVAPTILRTAIVILPTQKTKKCEFKIDAMRDRVKIDRDRRFTPPTAYLRKPAHCGRAARVAPPSLRFTLCTTHVRKNYYPADSHTNYQFLKKVKIRKFGCYNHNNVTNLANGDF